MKYLTIVYAAVFIVGFIIAFTMLTSYQPMPTHTARTVVITIPKTKTETVTQTVPYAIPSATPKPTPTSTVVAVRYVTVHKSVTVPQIVTVAIESSKQVRAVPMAVGKAVATELRKSMRMLAERGRIGIELTDYSIEVYGTRYIFKLELRSRTAERAFVTEVYVYPQVFPFGWNGREWVVEFEEQRCLLRISSPTPYSYTVEPKIIEFENTSRAFLTIYIDFVSRPYGKYILKVVFNTGDTIELKFTTPGYSDPTTTPPREILEHAKRCGYGGIGG